MREDLELLEINPLVVTPKGQLIACDAKVVTDDSAGFRHDPEDFPVSRMLEERALTRSSAMPATSASSWSRWTATSRWSPPAPGSA